MIIKPLQLNVPGTTLCDICDKYFVDSFIEKHTSQHQEDILRAKDGTLTIEYNNKQCPWCGFETTADVCDAETLQPLRNICVNKFCHWQQRKD